MEQHMFAGEADAAQEAADIAAWFNDHKTYRSDGRQLDIPRP